jgi:DHA1 family tetracycline resistance protein-like MFS transporter
MTDDVKTRAARGKSPLVVLFLIVVIDLIGFGIVLPLLPRYATEYHATPVMTGVLMASFSAMQFFFAPFWGRLSDRRGRRPILMVGLFGSIVSYTMFGLADPLSRWLHGHVPALQDVLGMDENAVQVYVLLASRIAAGFFGATIGAAQAYIADVTKPEERGRGMALIGAAFGIGFTIGPAIGGIAAGWHRYAPGFIAAGLSAFAFVLAAGSLAEPPQHGTRAEKSLFDLTAVRHALATPTIPLILGLQFIATFAFANFESTLSLQTQARWGYNERENGLVFAYVGLCLVVAQGAVVRRLMPKVGELRFVVQGALLMAVGLAGVGFAPSLAWLLIALLVAVLGFAMVTPSLSSLLSRRTSATTQGEILGLGQSMLSLARILGPLMGNVLFGWAFALPDVVAANLVLVAFLGALVLARRRVPDAG